MGEESVPAARQRFQEFLKARAPELLDHEIFLIDSSDEGWWPQAFLDKLTYFDEEERHALTRYSSNRGFLGLATVTDKKFVAAFYGYHPKGYVTSYGSFVLCAVKHKNGYEHLVEYIKGLRQLDVRKDAKTNIFRSYNGSLAPKPKQDWDSIFLDPELKAGLQAELPSFLASRDFYKERKLTYKRGILLYGSPGNGKTMISRAIANQSDIPFFLFSPSHDQGNTTIIDKISRMIEVASEVSPSVMCMEDLDTFFPERRAGPDMSVLLNLLDGVAPTAGIFFIATTNHPEILDPALICRPGRLDKSYEIGNPTELARKLFYSANLAELGDKYRDEFAKRTDTFSFAQLNEIVTSVHLDRYQDRRDVTIDDVWKQIAGMKKHLRLAKKYFKDLGAVGFTKGPGFTVSDLD